MEIYIQLIEKYMDKINNIIITRKKNGKIGIKKKLKLEKNMEVVP